MINTEGDRKNLKVRIAATVTASAGSLVIASALIAPATLQAAVNPQPAGSFPARVETIHSQIAGSGADLGGAQTAQAWHNWHNFPFWSNWPDWSNHHHRWQNWNDWYNHHRHHPWHNWNDWYNH